MFSSSLICRHHGTLIIICCCIQLYFPFVYLRKIVFSQILLFKYSKHMILNRCKVGNNRAPISIHLIFEFMGPSIENRQLVTFCAPHGGEQTLHINALHWRPYFSLLLWKNVYLWAWSLFIWNVNFIKIDLRWLYYQIIINKQPMTYLLLQGLLVGWTRGTIVHNISFMLSLCTYNNFLVSVYTLLIYC